MSSLLFGKRRAAPAAPAPNKDDSILNEIQDNRELIEKRRDFLTHKVAKETAEALAHKAGGRKEQALAALKRKKMLEKEIDGLNEQLFKLDVHEHTISALTFSATTTAIERRATQAIKEKMKAIGDADTLEERRAETEETLEDAYEMLGVVAQPLSRLPGVEQDDDELLEELERMGEAEAEAELEAQLSELQIPTSLPAARTETKAEARRRKEAAEEAELEALEAAMGSSSMAAMRVESAMPAQFTSTPMAAAAIAPVPSAMMEFERPMMPALMPAHSLSGMAVACM